MPDFLLLSMMYLYLLFLPTLEFPCTIKAVFIEN